MYNAVISQLIGRPVVGQLLSDIPAGTVGTGSIKPRATVKWILRGGGTEIRELSKAYSIVISGTCDHNDFQCRHWRQSWHHNNSRFVIYKCGVHTHTHRKHNDMMMSSNEITFGVTGLLCGHPYKEVALNCMRRYGDAVRLLWCETGHAIH